MLQGCSFLIKDDGPIRPDESLLQRCPEYLPDLQFGDSSSILRNNEETVDQYSTCATTHNKLVDWHDRVPKKAEKSGLFSWLWPF